MDFEFNYRSLATIIVWVFIVAGTCKYFYDQELKVGQTLPVMMAAHSLDADELSYVYEADISDLYGGSLNSENDVQNNIIIYKHEDKSKNEWGRIIVYDKSTTTFKYIIRSNTGVKISGVANYDATSNTYINTNETDEVEGCRVTIMIRSNNKAMYSIKNIPDSENEDCDKYNSTSTSDKVLFPNILHKQI